MIYGEILILKIENNIVNRNLLGHELVNMAFLLCEIFGKVFAIKE